MGCTAALDAGAWRMSGWLGAIKVREIGDEEVQPLDPRQRAFFNANTPDEFALAGWASGLPATACSISAVTSWPARSASRTDTSPDGEARQVDQLGVVDPANDHRVEFDWPCATSRSTSYSRSDRDCHGSAAVLAAPGTAPASSPATRLPSKPLVMAE